MDILSYLYYKGMVYLALERELEAIEQFRLVLSYPTQILHKVHTEAYKKCLLITLIRVAHGQIPVS